MHACTVRSISLTGTILYANDIGKLNVKISHCTNNNKTTKYLQTKRYQNPLLGALSLETSNISFRLVKGYMLLCAFDCSTDTGNASSKYWQPHLGASTCTLGIHYTIMQ